MDEKMLSVIVPVYNVDKFLERCVKSILVQNYSPMEIILVNDGSTDNSGKICDQFALQDNRVVVIHKENGGVASARNAGIEIAKGGYLTFVDGDDFLDNPGAYRLAVKKMEANKADIVAFLWQFMDTTGQLVVDPEKVPEFFRGGTLPTEKFAEGFYHGSYANGLVVSVWNKLYKRDFIGELRFHGRRYEDDKFMTYLLAQNGTVACLNEFLYVYAQNDSSLTHTGFDDTNFTFLDVIKERVDLFVQNQYIRNESMKLFLNLYIEYYYYAIEASMYPYFNKRLFDKYIAELSKDDTITLKSIIRFRLFELSPCLYRRLVFNGGR